MVSIIGTDYRALTLYKSLSDRLLRVIGAIVSVFRVNDGSGPTDYCSAFVANNLLRFYECHGNASK